MSLLPRLPRRSRLAKLALSFWFAAMVGLSALLLARHLLALPRPSLDDAALGSLAALRDPGDSRTLAVHVLYAECRCSGRLVAHLLRDPRPKDVAEVVLFVGGDRPTIERLRSHGFRVEQVDAETLGERWHVKAVPLLVVVSPSGAVQYAGGYTTRKQGPDPRDVEIIQRARLEQAVAALPVFGCAVAEDLRRGLDPTGAL